MSNGFSKSNGDPTFYIKAADGNVLIVVLYVDDLIFTGNNNFLIFEFKEAIKNEFEITDLGLLCVCRMWASMLHTHFNMVII